MLAYYLGPAFFAALRGIAQISKVSTLVHATRHDLGFYTFMYNYQMNVK
ncbi:hypothetical protein ABENE_14455 [Asticcacaulis benevestitus DSM 16100 = ATCC BAA-896]|uniref:Uncharacterized protein n=1 Tax=Asticcacaulis benevestitus DSM 16100 = ATCC BAA-896 TaxID=1121022 RepID=V4P5G0_9CAUL|nr:hypothetical protein ABENE_14455 [Asticcacaulis benevestitus DSM 16100 = ATCC BAA-896]